MNSPISEQLNPWRFCIAPMMDWTTSECRYFHRLLSRHARLYTEMVTANAIIHGDRDRLLGYDANEHPLALQLGGSDPAALATAAVVAEQYGYDEINLNCGCPSDRVRNGQFGACLMAEPERVAQCVSAMNDAVAIPVTVKCRLGIDDLDSDEHLHRFVATVHAAGCEVFIVHARKAWLNGLSPKQNREVPPLQYGRVAALKAAFPQLTIVLNGGLVSLDQAQDAMAEHNLNGVMLGRAAYQDPYLLAGVDQQFFDSAAQPPSREEVIAGLFPRLAQMDAAEQPARHQLRHILGLYNQQPGAKKWRQCLSQPIELGRGQHVLEQAQRALESTKVL